MAAKTQGASAGAEGAINEGGQAALAAQNNKQMAEQIAMAGQTSQVAHDAAMLNMELSQASAVNGIKYQ